MARFDPTKKTTYHVIPQWDGIPDYGVALVGNAPPSNVKVYGQRMDSFARKGLLERTIFEKLIYDQLFIDKFVLRSPALQSLIRKRTSYDKMSFDTTCNNVLIFEGTYSPKAYLRSWKEKNNLIFVLWITDVKQFSEVTRYNISVSPYDYVLSEYAPPPEYSNLIDAMVEVCTPRFEHARLATEFEQRFSGNHNLSSRNLDVFLAASSTPVRDHLILPLCDAIRKAGLKSYLVYSGLNEVPERFSSLRLGFPDSSRHLHPIENNFLTQISNCLIEVTKTDPPHVVERFQKAVMYNKKYIGNNPGIASSPFFNPEWMKIITDPEEITPSLIGWMRKRENVDYGYDGRWEFSRTVLSSIEKLNTSSH